MADQTNRDITIKIGVKTSMDSAVDGLKNIDAAAKQADSGSLFRNFHLFPLGGFARTVAWSNATRSGRYLIAADGNLSVG